MILGLLAIVTGNILIWQSGEETTQFFSGWVFGAFALSASGGLKNGPQFIIDGPRVLVGGAAIAFMILNPQTITTVPSDLNCVHGIQKVLKGVSQCVCDPPYTGELCDLCAVGAIIESGSNDYRNATCKTCYHQYEFPFCKYLLPGYETTTKCKSRWQPSCYTDKQKLVGDLTYDKYAPGIRSEFVNYDEDVCTQINLGLDEFFEPITPDVYCDKCKTGSGRYCCPDGLDGRDCTDVIPKCTEMGDRFATVKPNMFPIAYTRVDPKRCYPLDDDPCSCGGDFIGDSMCESNFCDAGKCSSVARSPPYDQRCKCDVGVGPDCETPTCYGGTRSYNGAAVCTCNSKHSDTHDACGVEIDLETCYPGLFGSSCTECQCAADVSDVNNVKLCPKNKYGVFDRDFRTKELIGCKDSGYCTTEPDDCGKVENGADRCLLFTNPVNLGAVLFSGYKCNVTTPSPCFIGERCQL